MNLETLQLLQAADDSNPENCESPPGFNWYKARHRVRPLKPVIEAIIGRSLEMDEQVQDASFFTELAAYVPGQNLDEIEVAVAITFSAFGDLFTVWNSVPGAISEPIVQKIIAIVQENGFHYVDGTSLSEAYSGENPVFQNETWSDRFFNYV